MLTNCNQIVTRSITLIPQRAARPERLTLPAIHQSLEDAVFWEMEDMYAHIS